MKLTEDMEDDLSAAESAGNKAPVTSFQLKMAPISPSSTCAVKEVSAIIKEFSSVNGVTKSEKSDLHLPNGKMNHSEAGQLISPLFKHMEQSPEDEEGLGVEVETYSRTSSPEPGMNGHKNENGSQKIPTECNGVGHTSEPNSGSTNCQVEPDDLDLSVQSDEFHLRMSDDDADEHNDAENPEGDPTSALSKNASSESCASVIDTRTAEPLSDDISCDKGSGVLEGSNTASSIKEDVVKNVGNISPDEYSNSHIIDQTSNHDSALGASDTAKSDIDITLKGSSGESCDDLLTEIESLCKGETSKQGVSLIPVLDSKSDSVDESVIKLCKSQSSSPLPEGDCTNEIKEESKCDIERNSLPVDSQNDMTITQCSEQKRDTENKAINISCDEQKEDLQEQRETSEILKDVNEVGDNHVAEVSLDGNETKSIPEVCSKEEKPQLLLDIVKSEGLHVIAQAEDVDLSEPKSHTEIAPAKTEGVDGTNSANQQQAEVIACKKEESLDQNLIEDGDKTSKEFLNVIDKEEKVDDISGKDVEDSRHDSDCEVVTHVKGSEPILGETSAFDKLVAAKSNDNNLLSESLACKLDSPLNTSDSSIECISGGTQSSLPEVEEDSNVPTPIVTLSNDTGLDLASDNGLNNQDSSSPAVQLEDSVISKAESDANQLSRKRTLSLTDEDSQDSVKKKMSRLKDITGDNEKLNALETLEDAHKRHASELDLVEPKKIRISNKVQNSGREQEDEKQLKDCEKLLNIQEAASSRGVQISDPPKTPQSNLDLAIECVVAKAATAAAPSEPLNLPFLRKLFQGELQSMSRFDLEELVLQKICEAIAERGLTGELRLRCQSLEKNQDKWRDRVNSLRKQVHELSLVVKKYLEQSSKSNGGRSNPPVRITRSVGLQVTLPLLSANRQLGCAGRPRSGPASSSNVTQQAVTSPKATLPALVRPEPPKQLSSPSSPIQGNAPVVARAALSGARLIRPMPNITQQTALLSGPPALVPTSAPNSTVFVSVPISVSGVGSRQAIVTSPRPKAPAQVQNVVVRPRLSVASNLSTLVNQPQNVQRQQIIQNKQPVQNKQIVQNKQTSSQSGIKQVPANSDVEVIDISDKEDQAKQQVLRISQQQHQHQQQQAANAAAHNLAANGMTVRLVSPSQPGMTLQPVYVPTQGGVPSKMFITSASQVNQLRGKTHIIMKGTPGNLIIPLQQNQGMTVPSSAVVHAVGTAQSTHQIPPVQQIFTTATGNTRTSTVATVRPQLQGQQPANQRNNAQHPAPLPHGPGVQATNPGWKLLPPKPSLKIQHQNNGIVLSWNMVLGPSYADIESYQLYAYQEGVALPSSSLWKKVGDVKALPLPMACTLTQFVKGHRYHFTVRAVDKHNRVGPFSLPGSIRLGDEIYPSSTLPS